MTTNSTPWQQTIRRETGLIEHICEHGTGHPAWGSADWMADTTRGDDNVWMVHGCDGCCHSEEWQLASLKESVRIANDIIRSQHKYIHRLIDEDLLENGF